MKTLSPSQESPSRITVEARGVEGRNRMLTESLVSAQMERLTSWVSKAAQSVSGDAEAALSALETFSTLYDARPVQDNKGGSGFNDSLWLFVMAAMAQPDLIVESGVFKGHSTWLLRQACPKAEIHCFDPELGNLVYRDPEACYHAGDWLEADVSVPAGMRGLAFFDDHMNQGHRVREAYTRGFRRLLFDDNFPAGALHATGHPPLPSLEMIFDPSLPETGALSWVRNAKRYRGVYDMRERESVKGLIVDYLVLPELAPVTCYPPGSGLTYVKLVD